MVGTAKLDDAQRKISFYRQPIRWYHFNKKILLTTYSARRAMCSRCGFVFCSG